LPHPAKNKRKLTGEQKTRGTKERSANRCRNAENSVEAGFSAPDRRCVPGFAAQSGSFPKIGHLHLVSTVVQL